MVIYDLRAVVQPACSLTRFEHVTEGCTICAAVMIAHTNHVLCIHPIQSDGLVSLQQCDGLLHQQRQSCPPGLPIAEHLRAAEH
jgi:hypothetical protein